MCSAIYAQKPFGANRERERERKRETVGEQERSEGERSRVLATDIYLFLPSEANDAIEERVLN